MTKPMDPHSSVLNNNSVNRIRKGKKTNFEFCRRRRIPEKGVKNRVFAVFSYGGEYERLQIHQMCHRRRWCRRKDLLADFIHQQYFSHGLCTNCFRQFQCKCCCGWQHVNIGLWDTAGQEDYNRLRPLSYRGADVFILAFSLISKASYENVAKKWIPELKHYAPGVPIVLVGTKLDLRDDEQYFVDHPSAVPISTVQGEELRKQIESPAYIECSSKTQQNVKSVFDSAIKVVLQPPKKIKKKKAYVGCAIL